MIANGRLQLYPFLRLTAMLAAGIAVADMAAEAVPVWAWAAAFAAFMATSAALHSRPLVQSVLILLGISAFGGWNAARQATALTVKPSTCEECYEAVVASKPMPRGKIVRCDLLITRGRMAGKKIRATILRQPDGNSAESLAVGDGIKAASLFEQPQVTANARHNFNYTRWMKVQGYAAQTFINRHKWQRTVTSLDDIPRTSRIMLRARMVQQRLAATFKQSSLTANALALVSAMTLGDKSGLSAETKEAYSISGASHILALSGLHIGIIYAVLSLLSARSKRQWASQTVTVATIWLYAIMVGMSPSVVRSATMFTLYAIASLLHRPRLSLNVLAFAAFAILAANPQSLWDVGFEMSFLAVLGIATLYAPIYHAPAARHLTRWRVARWLWGMTAVSLSAQLFTAPVVAFYFGRFSCYFLIANLIAVPLATILIYSSLALLAATPVPVLQEAVANIVQLAVTALDTSMQWIAGLPGASIEGININPLQLAMIYVFIVCMCLLGRYAMLLAISAHGKRADEYPQRPTF